VMVATYPCTKYSPIGDIHGVRTGDDLFLYFFRHVAIRRPELYVVENVPGMKRFPVVMKAMTKLPDYYVHVACPVKSSTWLPQKRDRLIIIGSRRNFAWREPRAERAIKLKEIVEPEAAHSCGTLPNGRATAPTRVVARGSSPTIKEGSVTQHSIIEARQFISLTVNNVVDRSFHVSFLPQVRCAAVPRPGFDILRQQARSA